MNIIKQNLKDLSKEIVQLKQERSPNYVGTRIAIDYTWASSRLVSARFEFRYKHIAYCLAKGRKYEEIESKVKKGNEPSWNNINHYKEKYIIILDELKTQFEKEMVVA